VAGHKVTPGGAVYAATKYAVRALSEGLRQEVKPYPLRGRPCLVETLNPTD
jgi:NADP-dependent 3-hydroxy acid dehydrogenase YdfG